jgi:predicted  nucleic acid-binding Zn-ribbon protein
MKKETKTKAKKETGTEMLARLVVNGFEKIRGEIKETETRIKEELKKEISLVKEEVSSVKEDVSSIKEEVSSIKQRVSSIEEEQKETNRRLASIERKQVGTTLSLDETVHRSEFDGIVHRVEALEKK